MIIAIEDGHLKWWTWQTELWTWMIVSISIDDRHLKTELRTWMKVAKEDGHLK